MTDLLILSATAGAGALIGWGLRGLHVARYRTAMQGYHDELVQAQNRIARALEAIPPYSRGSNGTAQRIGKILRGEITR